jgi:hypothetical protein
MTDLEVPVLIVEGGGAGLTASMRRWCMNRVKNRFNHPDHGFALAPWAKLPP